MNHNVRRSCTGICLMVAILGPLARSSAAGDQRELERSLATLRAAGHPTSIAELVELEKIPAGAKNAAGLYEEAARAFVLPTSANKVNVPMLGGAEMPDLGEPLPEPMVEAIAAYLQRNSKCLSLLHEAAGIEHCQFNRDERGEPPIIKAKMCAHLLALAAVYQADRGDSDAAIVCITDALRLCQITPDERDLLGHIQRCAHIGLIVRRIEQVLNVTPLTNEQSNTLDRACAQMAASLDIARALDTERCFLIEDLTNPALRRDGHMGFPAQILDAADKTLPLVLDYMAKYIEAVNLPMHQRLARIEEIDEGPSAQLAQMDEMDESEFPPENPALSRMVAAAILPSVHRTVELDMFCRADLRSTRTMLAVQRYRLAQGKRPETLDQLVPEYLDRVPTDPFDGRPIRYRRTDPGFIVYSIWSDGQDNNGIGRANVKRGDPFDSAFILHR